MAYSAILYRRPIFYKISASGGTPPTPSISVTYTNSVGGTISTSGQTDVTEGTPFSNVATANTLFNFVEWLLSEDGGVTWVSISTDAELNYIYEGDSQSVTVKAMFEPDALNFYMPDGGTITLTRNGSPTVVELEYSIDGGATWQVWEEVGNVRSITLAAGQKMYVRNTSETSTNFSVGTSNYYNFGFNVNTIVHGPVTSLLCKHPDIAVITLGCFAYLFRYAKIVTMPVLPMTSANYSYVGMFSETLIEETTEILVEKPKTGAFYYCFYGCMLLKVIRVRFTDVTPSDCITNWVSFAPATGDFYCPAELTITTGKSGIPTGWTRHDI